MNQREYRIGPGAASLMLLVVVLSMSVLGMLALMSARSDENLSLRSAEVARQVAELNVSAERSLAELDDALAKAAGAAQSEDDYLARVEAALNEAMTLEGRTVSWKETNDEGRTLACAVELEPFGAFPRFVRTVYHLAIDEGAMEGEDLLFDAGYIGEHSDELLHRDGDDDFSFSFNRQARFRCNAYKQRGTLAATCRVVTFGLPDPDALHIPPMVIDLVSSCRNGMVLVTGPAGSGKSTTLACMVDRINSNQDVHIITIEDPIEYLHAHKRALVSQREIPNDASSFARALRAAMREAPDVIMLGEMRDYETVQTALTAAETGHLLLSSLHTVGAAKTIDRIVDTFPANQQQQVRVQLSMVLRAVVSQRLVPTVDGTQVPVFEVMTINPAIQNMIRDGKTFQIDNAIYGGAASQAMLSMDNELIRLTKEGRITKEAAQLYAVNPDMLRKRLI